MNQLIILLASIVLVSCTGNKRIQEPKDPLPYMSVDVTFKSLEGSITLAGTLTTPINDSLKTAVVLVGGSAPGDRNNSNQFGHKMFLVLADYLTRRGITVLRYDERGVGESEGDYRNATYENMVSDIAGGIHYLRENGFKKIGIVGHSEGGGMGPEVSLKIKTDFLVLMAPANAKARDILIYQTGQRLNTMSVDERTRQEMIATADGLLTILEREPDPAIAKTKMENLILQKDKDATPEYKKLSQQLGDANRLITGWLDPKFIYTLHHDPLETLKKVRTPTLVMYGDQDGTTDPNVFLSSVKSEWDSTHNQIKIFSGIGHLFMNSQGLPAERLHEIEETLSPDVLETIGDWILQTRVN